MNETLEQFENYNFAAIESVYFIGFVVQQHRTSSSGRELANIENCNMAEENDNLLTEEELAAIEQMVAAGDLGGEGYNVGVAFSNHDLTCQDTSVGVNVTAIEQINDRLHRFMRIGLPEELRYNARLQPARTEIVRYADYVSDTSPPLAVNVTKIDPLRGECLVVIHSQVVFSCLDNWFGGSPKSLTSVPAGRIFTPTESAVNQQDSRRHLSISVRGLGAFMQGGMLAFVI